MKAFKFFAPAVLGGLLLVGAPAVPQEAAPEGQPVQAQAENKDADMAAKIRQSLAGDSSISPEGKQVSVAVEGGKATLTGTVASDTEKDKVEGIAAAIVGAGNVDNKLEVKK